MQDGQRKSLIWARRVTVTQAGQMPQQLGWVASFSPLRKRTLGRRQTPSATLTTVLTKSSSGTPTSMTSSGSSWILSTNSLARLLHGQLAQILVLRDTSTLHTEELVTLL